MAKPTRAGACQPGRPQKTRGCIRREVRSTCTESKSDELLGLSNGWANFVSVLQ
jgi:hypothetical protein